jgi:hypothetical protein
VVVSAFVAQQWQGIPSLSLFSFFLKIVKIQKKKVASGGGDGLGTAGLMLEWRPASMAEFELCGVLLCGLCR